MMGKKVWFFDVDVTVWDLESRSTDEEEAHVGAHVQEHVEKRSTENLLYEVSGKHFATNFHVICAAVNLSTIVIVGVSYFHRA